MCREEKKKLEVEFLDSVEAGPDFRTFQPGWTLKIKNNTFDTTVGCSDVDSQHHSYVTFTAGCKT